MLVGSLLIGLYLSRMLGFSLVVNPVICCFLLLGGSVSFCLFLYLVLGFRWYMLLFCLVYVGGIYILFVYVSMFSPNVYVGLGYGPGFILISFFLFALFFYFRGLGVWYIEDFSHYVCSNRDNYGYCFFCLLLLLGFRLVSVICSSKDSFFR